jgi:predicted phage-related endonuclease
MTKGSGHMASTVSIQTETTKVSTTTEVVELDNTNAAVLIAKFEAAKAAIKALEEQKAEAESALRELLANAEVGTIAGVKRIKIAKSSNSKIDRKLLQEAYPEAFEATLVVTPYTFLKTL